MISLPAQPFSKYGSWFINERVSSDSHFYLATRVDPRLLCLPFLEKNASKYSPLDQIVVYSDKLDDDGISDRIPLTNSNEWKLDEMCDMKDLGDMLLYRYNEGKTLEWLKNKV